MTPVTLLAQSSEWVTDSLAIYSKKMDQALRSKDEKALIGIQSHVYKQGTKSLDTQIYDKLYSWVGDAEIKALPLVSAKIFHNLGNLEFYRSRMGAAKDNFLLALENYQRADAKGDAAGMAMNLGIILERTGRYDSAIQNYERAMPIFLDVGDTAAIAVCLENIGIAYRYKGELQKSLTYLKRTDSVLTLTTAPNTIRWTYLYNNYSKILSLLGRYDEALDYAFNGLRISESLKDERQTNIG